MTWNALNEDGLRLKQRRAKRCNCIEWLEQEGNDRNDLEFKKIWGPYCKAKFNCLEFQNEYFGHCNVASKCINNGKKCECNERALLKDGRLCDRKDKNYVEKAELGDVG